MSAQREQLPLRLRVAQRGPAPPRASPTTPATHAPPGTRPGRTSTGSWEPRHRAWYRAQIWASVTVLLAAAYALLRTALFVTGTGEVLTPRGPGLVLAPGWWSAVLCVLAAGLAGMMLRWHGRGVLRYALAVAAIMVGAALAAAAPMFVLDVVSALLLEGDIASVPLGAASRVLCLALACTLAVTTHRWLIATGAGCPRCGRTHAPAIDESPPPWAYAGAALAVAGFLAPVLAQSAVDTVLFRHGTPVVLVEVGFVLAGVLLPCALVYAWGRHWPRWVPALRGRRVPRWLVLAPAVAASLSLVTYFGPVFAEMTWDRIIGQRPFLGIPALPESFFWIAVPAYVLWGVGLAIAAFAYHRQTRPRCRDCGR